MTDQASQYGGNNFGSSEYGGAVTVSESGSATAMITQSVNHATSGSEKRSVTTNSNTDAVASTGAVESATLLKATLLELLESADGFQSEFGSMVVNVGDLSTVNEIGTSTESASSVFASPLHVGDLGTASGFDQTSGLLSREFTVSPASEIASSFETGTMAARAAYYIRVTETVSESPSIVGNHRGALADTSHASESVITPTAYDFHTTETAGANEDSSPIHTIQLDAIGNATSWDLGSLTTQPILETTDSSASVETGSSAITGVPVTTETANGVATTGTIDFLPRQILTDTTSTVEDAEQLKHTSVHTIENAAAVDSPETLAVYVGKLADGATATDSARLVVTTPKHISDTSVSKEGGSAFSSSTVAGTDTTHAVESATLSGIIQSALTAVGVLNESGLAASSTAVDLLESTAALVELEVEKNMLTVVPELADAEEQADQLFESTVVTSLPTASASDSPNTVGEFTSDAPDTTTATAPRVVGMYGHVHPSSTATATARHAPSVGVNKSVAAVGHTTAHSVAEFLATVDYETVARASAADAGSLSSTVLESSTSEIGSASEDGLARVPYEETLVDHTTANDGGTQTALGTYETAATGAATEDSDTHDILAIDPPGVSPTLVRTDHAVAAELGSTTGLTSFIVNTTKRSHEKASSMYAILPRVLESEGGAQTEIIDMFVAGHLMSARGIGSAFDGADTSFAPEHDVADEGVATDSSMSVSESVTVSPSEDDHASAEESPTTTPSSPMALGEFGSATDHGTVDFLSQIDITDRVPIREAMLITHGRDVSLTPEHAGATEKPAVVGDALTGPDAGEFASTTESPGVSPELLPFVGDLATIDAQIPASIEFNTASSAVDTARATETIAVPISPTILASSTIPGLRRTFSILNVQPDFVSSRKTGATRGVELGDGSSGSIEVGPENDVQILNDGDS